MKKDSSESKAVLSVQAKPFLTPISFGAVFWTLGIVVYIALSFLLLVTWIAPSLDGRTDQHIGADSALYVNYADELRESPAATLIAVLYSYSFPNTLLFPVLLAFAIKSAVTMALLNYSIFILATVLLKKSFTFSTEAFVSLMLLNATTTISLLTVNKEIIDFLAVSIFLFAKHRHRSSLIVLALVLALLNRFEVCAVIMAFIFAESRLNPWRERRGATLIVLITAISIVLPLVLPTLASKTLNEESDVNHGAITLFFNNLEMHYLYAIAMIPKLGALFFAELIDFKNWQAYGAGDYANTYILLSNNIANAIIWLVLAWKRRIALGSTVMYFAILGCVINAVSFSKQPRYLFFAYSLLCLEAARKYVDKPSWGTVPPFFAIRAEKGQIA